MKNYQIYVKRQGKKLDDVRLVKTGFSFIAFLIGPFAFLFYRMWQDFFLFLLLLIAIFYGQHSGFISSYATDLSSMMLHLYLAIDFFNRFEAHLLEKGYEFEADNYLDSKVLSAI